MEWVYIYGGIAVFLGGIGTGLVIYRKCVIDDLHMFTDTELASSLMRNISTQIHGNYCETLRTQKEITDISEAMNDIRDHVEVLRLSK